MGEMGAVGRGMAVLRAMWRPANLAFLTGRLMDGEQGRRLAASIETRERELRLSGLLLQFTSHPSGGRKIACADGCALALRYLPKTDEHGARPI